jgi:outer membrane biosynthesis protein TonB
MMMSGPQPEWRRREHRPLLWAFGVAVLLHLVVGFLYTMVALWVKRSPTTAPEWAVNLVNPVVPEARIARLQPPAEQGWQEIPLTFIEVDPANALPDETKDAKFYSNANTKSGQPIPSDKKLNNPEIAGTQKTTPKTFDTDRPTPAQPAPQPEPKDEPDRNETDKPQQAKEAQQPQPLGGPKDPGETLMAMANPKAAVDKTQEEKKAVEAQQAGTTRRKPIKKLAEAREQKGIIRGEKMFQEGGSSRLSISPSFDVKNSPFGDYDLRMVAAVQERWWALLDERRYALERTGKVVLKFNLHADGTISQIQTEQSEVGDLLGFTCEAAVLGASPFGRWPTVLRAQAQDPREVTFTFNYY